MNNRFDQKARELDEHPVMREVALKFSQTLLSHVPLSQKYNILDYGCGSGLIGMHLYKKVNSLVMMDTSEGMLCILKEKILKNNINNMEIINCELEKAQIEPDKFDVIYINNVLHHIEDISSFLAVVKKSLKPKGYFCIGDLEKEDGSFHSDNADVRHFGFEEHEIEEYLANCNFEKIKNERYYTVKKPDNSGKIKQYPMFFISATKS
ncbi:MAG: class I SAM-dependent methyltransferase [Desulfamplus sp.]|nr:class I SAM-dependent methyltransferase [Desulfamplus sp.]